jgi:enoyl-[acyl-carrier protein] reductase II
MQWVSDWSLVSAVSNAGGFGILAAADYEKEDMRNEIRKTKEATNKPFAMNITLISQTVKETFEVVAEEKVPFVVLTAGNPAPYLPLLKEAGIPFFAVVATVKQALKMEELGACLIVAEGEESGGHIGNMTTMALIPQIASALKKVPVVAAGGIADGRGMAAAFMLGAEGIQMGTAFMASEECTIHKNVKKAIIESDSSRIIVAKRRIGRPVRCLDNALMKSFVELDERCAPKDDYSKLWAGTTLRASREGDTENASVMVGQIIGLVNTERSVSAIIQDVLAEYNGLRQSLPEFPG